MRSTWRIEWLILATFLGRAACDAQCFGVGGQKSSATPCNSDATGTNGSHSSCCDETKQEACLSTGLCYAAQRNDNITFWAEGCTDPSGLDPSCPQYCGATSQFVSGPIQTSYTMLFCGSSSWCCCFNSFGKKCDVNDCCTRNFTLTRGLGQVVRQFDGSTSDPSATAGASGGFRGPSGGAARITVAVLASVLGALLLITFIAFWVSLYRNRRLRKQLAALENLHNKTQSIIAARGLQPLRLSMSMNAKDEATSPLSWDMTQTPSYHQPPTPSSMAPGYIYSPPTVRRPSWPRNVRSMEGMPELPNGVQLSELPGDKDVR
ncbi:hypothetical protein GQ53DRAFT_858863 [Thozetella sp. PMI_491]|nr:hypothetical protein GQ53DRAFT_858863 [Thozetella sp. PMI_491]